MIKTAEAVSLGHPDKIADYISVIFWTDVWNKMHLCVMALKLW